MEFQNHLNRLKSPEVLIIWQEIVYFILFWSNIFISIHILSKRGTSTNYFGWGWRFCGNLVPRFPIIIPPCFCYSDLTWQCIFGPVSNSLLQKAHTKSHKNPGSEPLNPLINPVGEVYYFINKYSLFVKFYISKGEWNLFCNIFKEIINSKENLVMFPLISGLGPTRLSS